MTLLASWPTVTDDDGSKQFGTIFNKALTDAVKASVEDNVHSATNPTLKTKTIIDEVVAARGGRTDLLTRLLISQNSDGTVKDLVFPAGESGSLSGKFPAVTLRSSVGTNAGNINAAETDLVNLTIPGLTFTADGQFLNVEVAFLFANNANLKTIRMYWAGTALSVLASAAAVAGNMVILRMQIIRASSTAAFFRGYVSHGAASGAAPTLLHYYGQLSGTADFTISQAFKITGQATTTNDIVVGQPNIVVNP